MKNSVYLLFYQRNYFLEISKYKDDFKEQYKHNLIPELNL